jgi:hypothetical protein
MAHRVILRGLSICLQSDAKRKWRDYFRSSNIDPLQTIAMVLQNNFLAIFYRASSGFRWNEHNLSNMFFRQKLCLCGSNVA